MPNSINMNFLTIMPELFLIFSALTMLIVGVFTGNKFALRQLFFTKQAIITAMVLLLFVPVEINAEFTGMFLTSGFTNFCKFLVLFGTLLVLILTSAYYKNDKKEVVCEYPVLILLSVVGMMLMISANGLISLYMAIELQSLALYILASINTKDAKSSEAGLKYFVLGALASGVILYGCSLIYGFTSVENFDALKAVFIADDKLSIGVLVGLIFLVTGICFKLSAVPFHMWTPDVYEGSPTTVTAFFAVAPKIAAMALIIRLLMSPFGDEYIAWQQIIIFVSSASMIIGALGAIRQSNIKRLIAYSSIGHVGYMLVGLASASQEGIKAILFYLVIYISLAVGIFACIMLIKRKEGDSYDISTLSGLAKTRPYIALVIAILMLSMAGIPPFAGFFGKLFIFLSAVKQELYILAVLGVLSSVIAAFYYLRIIKIMYFDEASVELDKNDENEMRYLAFAAAAFNLFFFAVTTKLLNISDVAASWLF